MLWAVATPGDEGVGRLPSRSKRGRYRPKFGSLLAPLPRSVAGHLLFFLPLPLAADGILAAKPNEKARRDLFPSPTHPLGPSQRFWVVASICLYSWQFARYVPGIWMERLPEIWDTPSTVSSSAGLSARFPRGSLKIASDEPHTIVRKMAFTTG